MGHLPRVGKRYHRTSASDVLVRALPGLVRDIENRPLRRVSAQGRHCQRYSLLCTDEYPTIQDLSLQMEFESPDKHKLVHRYPWVRCTLAPKRRVRNI